MKNGSAITGENLVNVPSFYIHKYIFKKNEFQNNCGMPYNLLTFFYENKKEVSKSGNNILTAEYQRTNLVNLSLSKSDTTNAFLAL